MKIVQYQASQHRAHLLSRLKTKFSQLYRCKTKSDLQTLEKEIKALEDLGTRFHKSKTGQETPRILAAKYKALIPNGRDDVSVNLVDVRRSPQDNLVVRIEGSEKPDEVIILGSHIDSIVGVEVIIMPQVEMTMRVVLLST